MTPLLAQRPRSDRGFERLYKRHVGDVYRYALAVMRNPTDAEDVTQTTFLNAYRAYVEKGSRPEKPQNWLIAIAHNVCRQRFRQAAAASVRGRRSRTTSRTRSSTTTTSSARGHPACALGHLAFNQRAALVMRELEGRSLRRDRRDPRGLDASAVETLIFRARRALRETARGVAHLRRGRVPRSHASSTDGFRGESAASCARTCASVPECAGFARRQRAQRGALKTLALAPRAELADVAVRRRQGRRGGNQVSRSRQRPRSPPAWRSAARVTKACTTPWQSSGSRPQLRRRDRGRARMPALARGATSRVTPARRRPWTRRSHGQGGARESREAKSTTKHQDGTGAGRERATHGSGRARSRAGARPCRRRLVRTRRRSSSRERLQVAGPDRASIPGAGTGQEEVAQRLSSCVRPVPDRERVLGRLAAAKRRPDGDHQSTERQCSAGASGRSRRSSGKRQGPRGSAGNG